MTDNRLFAITTVGRKRLQATTVDEAFAEVKSSTWLNKTTQRIVRETRVSYDYPEGTLTR